MVRLYVVDWPAMTKTSNRLDMSVGLNRCVADVSHRSIDVKLPGYA